MIDTPFLETRHAELAAQIDRFNRERPQHHTASEDEQARAVVRELADAGLLAQTVPADLPSATLDVRALCVAREHLSYDSSLSDLMFAMQGLGSFPVTIAASAALKGQWLPRIKAGSAIAAFAITEPEAGSDVSAIKTTARRDGDEYVIDGTKTFISNAGLADFYTVFAKTDTAAGHRGISAFVVERDLPGFAVEERLELIAPHPIGRLRFAGCQVPAG